ncbi:Fic family protein [Corynebacterium lizhenjunii]|uniref:Fic family protein n=1 Tax=Corynebacterium lizhenjunii TaxID=2709394 RepID=A0A7T0KE36_9CORY|nr:Fic family protein [Corynebacterium lizhenjunii]QPK79103.1 Fic family protein [Corynebacterium lizhenjunii]
MLKATSRVSWQVRDHGDIGKLGTERALFRLTKQLPDLVWNAAALEGNTFTLPEVRTLLDGVTVGGKSLPEQQQILDLSEAFNLLADLVRTEQFDITAQVSNQLHQAVAGNEALDAGMFRGDGAVTGDGGGVRLTSGMHVPFDAAEQLHSDYQALLGSLHALSNPVERALAYFCSATRSQFYFDGNKRTARLVASGMLLSAGYSALNIPHARRLEFNCALDQLFATDDATDLMAFLYDCLVESSRESNGRL